MVLKRDLRIAIEKIVFYSTKSSPKIFTEFPPLRG